MRARLRGQRVMAQPGRLALHVAPGRGHRARCRLGQPDLAAQMRRQFRHPMRAQRRDRGIEPEREQRPRAQGWRVHIQRKGQAGKPLSDCQERRNKRIAKVRARVEHVFAGLEQMGGKALRSIGLARATLHLNWKAATYNLRRLCSLMEAGPTPF